MASTMTDSVAVATAGLLEPAELTVGRIEALLGSMGAAVDIGEAYLQNNRNESWTLEDGAVSQGSFSVAMGRQPVLFSADAARSLVDHLVDALAGP